MVDVKFRKYVHYPFFLYSILYTLYNCYKVHSFCQLSNCKAEGQGSVVAEVGSEHCDSDGHDTDLENSEEVKGQTIDQIDVLKGEISLTSINVLNMNVANILFL